MSDHWHGTESFPAKVPGTVTAYLLNPSALLGMGVEI
jgi:hypothetical protein